MTTDTISNLQPDIFAHACLFPPLWSIYCLLRLTYLRAPTKASYPPNNYCKTSISTKAKMTNSWFVIPTHEGKCFVYEWLKPGCPRAVVLQPCPRHAKGQAKLLQHTSIRIRANNSLRNVCYHMSDKQL